MLNMIYCLLLCRSICKSQCWDIWVTTWQNQQDDPCTQRRLRSAWAFSQSDQRLGLQRLISQGGYLSWSVFAGRTAHFFGFAMLQLIWRCAEDFVWCWGSCCKVCGICLKCTKDLVEWFWGFGMKVNREDPAAKCWVIYLKLMRMIEKILLQSA